MVKVMDEKYRLDIDDLENVTGGTQVAATTPRLSVGDRVTIRLYPEYGVGTVTNVYLKIQCGLVRSILMPVLWMPPRMNFCRRDGMNWKNILLHQQTHLLRKTYRH